MERNSRRKLNILTLLIVVVSFVFSLMAVQKPLVAEAASGSTTVYVTDYGEKYHTSSCQYLYNSKNAISLQTAVNRGYTACSKCNPPRLTGGGSTTTPSRPTYDNTPEEEPLVWPWFVGIGGAGVIGYGIYAYSKKRKEENEYETFKDQDEE